MVSFSLYNCGLGGERSNCLHLGERRNINKEPSFGFITVICHLVRDNIKSLSVVRTVHSTQGKFFIGADLWKGKEGLASSY